METGSPMSDFAGNRSSCLRPGSLHSIARKKQLSYGIWRQGTHKLLTWLVGCKLSQTRFAELLAGPEKTRCSQKEGWLQSPDVLQAWGVKNRGILRTAIQR